MCSRLMANIQMIDKAREVFASREAFDYHPTTKHKEQDPFPDQLKGMWFCIQYKFFQHSPGRKPVHIPISGDSGNPVPKAHTNIIQQGQDKVTKRFSEKLHACFPEYRLINIQKAQSTESAPSSGRHP